MFVCDFYFLFNFLQCVCDVVVVELSLIFSLLLLLLVMRNFSSKFLHCFRCVCVCECVVGFLLFSCFWGDDWGDKGSLNQKT